MRLFSNVIGTFLFAAALIPVPVNAQNSFDIRPDLTKAQFVEFTAELGSILRFRQLGDTTTLGKGTVDVSVQFGSMPAQNDDLSRSISFPRIVARFGASDRVDVGAWGGFEPDANYGLAGVDTKINLLRQGPARPVSVSIRPSITSLIGPSEVWAANASIDLSVSRAFGRVWPYVGVATTASVALERSTDVDLDPVTADGSLVFAGVSYHWRAVVASAEVEKGTSVTYAFRLGTRF